MPPYYFNNKLLYVDGRLAFGPACCCNIPCNRMVFVVAIAAGAPFYTEPPTPPLRGGNGGNSYLMSAGNSYDTYSSPRGTNYRNKVWTIEFCFNQYDILPSDNLHPSESYIIQLQEWACQAYLDWTQLSTCIYDVEVLDDPYDIDTYTGTGGVVETYLDMSGIVGSNWEYEWALEPILKSNCPNCACSFSCIPDGT